MGASGVRSGARALGLLGIFIAFLLFTPRAEAYPYFVGLRQINCADCHYSPTGGGLINDWGRQSRGVTWGDVDAWSAHSDARGHDDAGKAKLQADFGADARFLGMVPVDESGGPTALFFPMLLELDAVAAYGPVEAYASITPRAGTPGGSPYLLFSREHWLLFRVADEVTVRAGRMVLPFGLRTPDHTQYVREDFAFDKWDQSYALELDVARDEYTLSAAAFAGDLTWVPAERQERGSVVRGTLTLGESRGYVGAAVLGSRSEARDRAAGSVFTALRPFDQSYVLAELAAQRFWARQGDTTLDTGAAFLRLGWFLNDAVDLYAEGGYRRLFDYPDLTKVRAAVGSNWQVASWFEFVPQVMLEQLNGRGPELLLMGQLHLMH